VKLLWRPKKLPVDVAPTEQPEQINVASSGCRNIRETHSEVFQESLISSEIEETGARSSNLWGERILREVALP